MLLYKFPVFYIISLTTIIVKAQDVDIFSYLINGEATPILNADLYLLENNVHEMGQDKVEIKLYYESFCPYCRSFDTMHLIPTVEKLASYLNLNLYPYGHAKTIDKGNGQYEFKCQHGPEECYGNKLHACTIDYLGNATKAVFLNSCMMDSARKNRGSDDEAADECGKLMNVDAEPIKQCAKGQKGTTLLKYYGDESKKVGFKYVPYILINGVVYEGSNFFKDVCAAFTSPPPECAQ